MKKGYGEEKEGLIGEIGLKLRCQRGEKGKQKAPHSEKDESSQGNQRASILEGIEREIFGEWPSFLPGPMQIRASTTVAIYSKIKKLKKKKKSIFRSLSIKYYKIC